MPIYRHECRSCGIETTDLYKLAADPPRHCGEPMRRLMPGRVVGRVVSDSNGVHEGSGFARAPSGTPSPAPANVWEPELQSLTDQAGESFELLGEDRGGVMPQQRHVAPDIDPDDPTAIPPQPEGGAFVDDYETCDAAKRDERWHDTAQAVAAWAAKGLEAKGEEPAAARSMASAAAQKTVEKARSQSMRADGLS